MLRIALALIVAGLFAATLAADEKSHKAAIEELLVASRTPENMKASIDTMLDLQVKQQPVLSAVRSQMKGFFEKYLGYDASKEELIKLYAEEFTEEEAKELTKFYQSPLGKKTAERVPMLSLKIGQMGASKIDAHKAELQQMIRDELLKSRVEPEKKP
jgi:hypothetical protein